MKPFTKLFSSIITSSIWNESDKVRVLWITLLALSDSKGFVDAALGGLAHAARITKEECEVALACLMAPDPDSRSEEFDGRRIKRSPGGWHILNYSKYREQARASDRTEYLAQKQRESRDRKKENLSPKPLSTGQQCQPNVNIRSTVNQSPSASASASSSLYSPFCTKQKESEEKEKSARAAFGKGKEKGAEAEKENLPKKEKPINSRPPKLIVPELNSAAEINSSPN